MEGFRRHAALAGVDDAGIYLPGANGLYLVEEPENGIHPGVLEELFNSLSCSLRRAGVSGQSFTGLFVTVSGR